jgi:hypothetical protein
MHGQAVNVIVMLAEEGLLVGGPVVDYTKCCTVIDQLLLVVGVEQIVADIVAPVSEHVLEFEVGVGGLPVALGGLVVGGDLVLDGAGPRLGSHELVGFSDRFEVKQAFFGLVVLFRLLEAGWVALFVQVVVQGGHGLIAGAEVGTEVFQLDNFVVHEDLQNLRIFSDIVLEFFKSDLFVTVLINVPEDLLSFVLNIGNRGPVLITVHRHNRSEGVVQEQTHLVHVEEARLVLIVEGKDQSGLFHHASVSEHPEGAHELMGVDGSVAVEVEHLHQDVGFLF